MPTVNYPSRWGYSGLCVIVWHEPWAGPAPMVHDSHMALWCRYAGSVTPCTYVRIRTQSIRDRDTDRAHQVDAFVSAYPWWADWGTSGHLDTRGLFGQAVLHRSTSPTGIHRGMRLPWGVSTGINKTKLRREQRSNAKGVMMRRDMCRLRRFNCSSMLNERLCNRSSTVTVCVMILPRVQMLASPLLHLCMWGALLVALTDIYSTSKVHQWWLWLETLK